MNLEEEAKAVEKILKGKIVEKIYRHKKNEFGIEFTDGTRIFTDQTSSGIEISITDGNNEK